MDFSPEFKKALNILEDTTNHLYLTGHAGTGKSTLLEYFVKNTPKNVALLAPTGVAAVNVGGETIHSFFRFPPTITPDEAHRIGTKHRDNKIYRSLQTIIIDEISMVRADLLDCIDQFLKANRANTLPFGNLQMVFVGDLYQLPPVVTSEDRDMIRQNYQTPYFFSSHVISELFQGLFSPLQFIELKKIYRQQEKDFVSILNDLRHQTISEDQLTLLNSRVLAPEETVPDHIVLTSLNETADRINDTHLAAIPSKAKTFSAVTTGHFPEKQFPVASQLVLKVGARVMLLNNDPDDQWINGTLGIVKELGNNSVLVDLDNGQTVTVPYVTWTIYKSVFNELVERVEKHPVGSFSQIPLRLAWAVTIHKSQGKTFANVLVDLSRGVFAHGQTYVALSRASTLEGLRLTTPVTKKHLIFDQRVEAFMKFLNQDEMNSDINSLNFP